ncbi:MAG: helix-turn-helix domain-containing protein [Defluviitaleaceae bacterium]|nr:helix-turn-helix domain-containing protein [Defluviitaleaceae bacterium]
MNEINLPRIIASRRREKGITQDAIANFLGVTKASVSKWETGTSFPDITFLPKLAAYFGISIDDLMGYEPQMPDEDIRKLYKELSLEFASQPFDEVMTRCRDIVKKYYSCYPLLFQMGVLYLNYGYYTVSTLNEEEKTALVEEIMELFLRVRAQSNDADLRQMTLHMLAICYLLLGNPEEVIRIFKDTSRQSPASNEVLMSQAYLMLGQTIEAKIELQNCIYDGVMNTLAVISTYLNICTDNATHFDEVCQRTLAMIRLWNVDNLVAAVTIPFYISAAAGYLALEQQDKALYMLEECTAIATKDILPLTMRRDDFFDLVTVSTQDLPFGTAELPRDEKTIKQSLVDGIANNPAFAPLYENQRFINIANRLKNTLLM